MAFTLTTIDPAVATAVSDPRDECFPYPVCSAKLAEIKGPRDRLSDQQRAWLYRFISYQERMASRPSKAAAALRQSSSTAAVLTVGVGGVGFDSRQIHDTCGKASAAAVCLACSGHVSIVIGTSDRSVTCLSCSRREPHPLALLTFIPPLSARAIVDPMLTVDVCHVKEDHEKLLGAQSIV